MTNGNPEHRYLDLRRHPAQKQFPPLPFSSTVSTFTGTGIDTTGGTWTIRGQRRQKTVNHVPGRMILIELHHPDGRVLHLTSLGFTQGNPCAHTGTLLGGRIGALLRPGNPASTTRAAAVEDLARLFTVAWASSTPTVQVRRNGRDLTDRLQAAAYNIPMARVTELREQIPPTLYPLLNLTEPALAPGEQPRLSVALCVLLDKYRVTPEQAYDLLGTALHWNNKSFTSVAAFAAAEWSSQDVMTLHRALGLHYGVPVPPVWARFTLDQALLIVDAGLTVEEAVTQHRTGTFDLDSVAALAALRRGSSDLLSYAA